MGSIVEYEVVENIAVITVDNPPVNALSREVRQGIADAIDRLAADDTAAAGVLICAGRTFIAGADISEFNKPPMDPSLPAVIARIEGSSKLVVAAIHGTALGGGLETAMACHYRCAVGTAKVGLPEVNLGLLPGASGTQRLPRLAGIEKALDMMISGKPIGAEEALGCGILDRLVETDLREGAIGYTKQLLTEQMPPRRLSTEQIDITSLQADFFETYRARTEKQMRGYFSPLRIIRCVEAATTLPYAEALKLERELFDECKASPHSKALRYMFFAEREVSRIPDVAKDTPVREIRQVAVIGAGTMGSGIAMNFLNAGLPVYLLEVNEDALDRGTGFVRSTYQSAISKGRMSSEEMDERLRLLAGTVDYAHLHDADLVIEAVFEDMEIKKEVFRKLDAICRPGTILASNTSTLDLDEIASVTGRAEDVIGLHFFAPANVMPLLEIVRGKHTSREVIATAMAMAKTIRKTGVLVGVCFGFVGNRMFLPYIREAELMVLEGVAPERIDRVVRDWGMAMGPHAVTDLSGLDVFYRINQSWSQRPDDPAWFRLCNVLYSMGRLGQKSGAGIYRYSGREPVPDPQLMLIATAEAEKLGIARREIEDDEIIERLLYTMINEGARVLEEGIALRPGDIDVIYVYGYGMPRYRGGPMCYADTVGIPAVYEAICKYRDRYGERYWTPAPMLERLYREGKTFLSG